jgi:hypothetical protein
MFASNDWALSNLPFLYGMAMAIPEFSGDGFLPSANFNSDIEGSPIFDGHHCHYDGIGSRPPSRSSSNQTSNVNEK